MKLVPIPKDKYEEYRLKLMFECYKWDPQFLDHNTVAKYVLVITEKEHEELAALTEKLDKETRAAEEFLNEHQELAGPLALPKSVKNEIRKMSNYEPQKHVRLMRYDFHPTIEGDWAVSEVNSDVPGGFAEATLMPEAAMELLTGSDMVVQETMELSPGCVRAPFTTAESLQGNTQASQETARLQQGNVSEFQGNREQLQEAGYRFISFGERMVEALQKKVPKGGRMMLVHCTSYSDDRQVMQFLGDRLKTKGVQVVYGAADHLRFENGTAFSILDGNEGKIDAIFRFTPLEWLTEIKPRRWQGYFDTITVSCNHPVAMYAQTKRFPLVWEALEQRGLRMATWRKLLPETIEVKSVKGREGFIYKPACGRVGEKIGIKEACKEDEYKRILAEVKAHPKRFLAQKKFHSRPVIGENGEEYHVCLGSYTVDGRHAGYYARISDTPRIDSNAADIPVLICEEVQVENRTGDEESRTSIGNRNHEIQGKEQVSPDSKDDVASKGEVQANLDNSIADRVQSVLVTDFSPEHTQSIQVAKQLYKIWAPVGKKWVDWVRPVPFVGLAECSKAYSISDFDILPMDFLGAATGDTAIIVDRSGAEGVKTGLALAKLGYRPIPIYNGTMEQQGARATVDNQSAATALLMGAELLAQIELKKDAPPAFLTDSNRMQRFKLEIASFDNSWDVYPQDLPSAEYFLAQGIDKIVIIGETFSKDLKKIFYSFQKKGIEFYFTQGYEAPKRVKIHKLFSKEFE